MKCPVCGGPNARVPECPDCRVVLTNESGLLVATQPIIRRGDVLASRDLRASPLPGESQRQWSRIDGRAAHVDPRGIVVTTAGTRENVFIEPWMRVRDASVRAAMAAIDGDLWLGVVARREPIGEARTFYSLDVWPERQSVRIARCVATPQTTHVFDLVPWTPSSAIARVGEWNEIELRVQGSALEAWINGARIGAVHDPVLGIGSTGIRLTRAPNTADVPRRACCAGFEVTMVAA